MNKHLNKQLNKHLLCAILATLTVPASAIAEPWDDANNPANFDEHYEYHYDRLPKSATLPNSKMPWSSSYWPRNQGSINYRWNTEYPTGFDLDYASKDEVRHMSYTLLTQLSPAEKWDLAQGHYNYPLSTMIAGSVDRDAKHFEGICDGWSATAVTLPEPKPVDVINPDGIKIPFGSSDIKALMSYDVSINQSSDDLGTVFVGSYCHSKLGLTFASGRCMDINPGAFHVVLANEIGLKQRAFAADVDPGPETWNQPVYGFSFEERGSVETEDGTRGILIHAKMFYAQDDFDDAETAAKAYHWNPAIGTANYTSDVMEVDYVLELDGSNRIVGGTWERNSRKNHPDLFWKPTKPIKWTADFQFLNRLYHPNRQ